MAQLLRLAVLPVKLTSSTSIRSLTGMAAPTTAIREITFVTGNANKRAEVEAYLAHHGVTHVTLHNRKLDDLPEIQGTPEQTARDKARRAAVALDGPALVEDTSLCFNALGGLPGMCGAG